VTVVNLMMNLGICLRAAKMFDFEANLRAEGIIQPPYKRLAASDAAQSVPQPYPARCPG
jgi:hypothetical protein